MSNKVSLQVCEFVDYTQNGNIRDRHYGYRICDDYDADYNNLFGSIREVLEETDHPIEYVEVYHGDFFESVMHAGGMYYCGDWISLDGPYEEEEEDE